MRPRRGTWCLGGQCVRRCTVTQQCGVLLPLNSGRLGEPRGASTLREPHFDWDGRASGGRIWERCCRRRSRCGRAPQISSKSCQLGEIMSLGCVQHDFGRSRPGFGRRWPKFGPTHPGAGRARAAGISADEGRFRAFGEDRSWRRCAAARAPRIGSAQRAGRRTAPGCGSGCCSG